MSKTKCYTEFWKVLDEPSLNFKEGFFVSFHTNSLRKVRLDRLGRTASQGEGKTMNSKP